MAMTLQKTAVLFLSGALALATAPAMAVPLDDESGFPQFDVIHFCRDATWQTSCIASEQNAANLLRQRWPSVSWDDRRRCLAVGRATSGGSYLATLGCLSKPVSPRS